MEKPDNVPTVYIKTGDDQSEGIICVPVAQHMYDIQKSSEETRVPLYYVSSNCIFFPSSISSCFYNFRAVFYNNLSTPVKTLFAVYNFNQDRHKLCIQNFLDDFVQLLVLENFVEYECSTMGIQMLR